MRNLSWQWVARENDDDDGWRLFLLFVLCFFFVVDHTYAGIRLAICVKLPLQPPLHPDSHLPRRWLLALHRKQMLKPRVGRRSMTNGNPGEGLGSYI